MVRGGCKKKKEVGTEPVPDFPHKREEEEISVASDAANK